MCFPLLQQYINSSNRDVYFKTVLLFFCAWFTFRQLYYAREVIYCSCFILFDLFFVFVFSVDFFIWSNEPCEQSHVSLLLPNHFEWNRIKDRGISMAIMMLFVIEFGITTIDYLLFQIEFGQSLMTIFGICLFCLLLILLQLTLFTIQWQKRPKFEFNLL